MRDILTLIIIMAWPIIPLFWIPVHFATPFFRRLGRLTYPLVALIMVPIVCFIFTNRDIIVAQQIVIPDLLSIAGLFLLLAGLLLQIWTAGLMTLRVIIGIPEIAAPRESRLVEKGAFSVIRHPTYLSHTMIFLGAFIFTGNIAVGLVTIVDLLAVGLIIIPLEEKELLRRFGQEYAEYMKRVPRLIPRISGRKNLN